MSDSHRTEALPAAVAQKPAPAPPAPIAQPAPASQTKPKAPETTESPREPGLSVRFYFVGEPMDRLCLLVQNQTPNISQVMPVLDFNSDKGDKIGDLESTFMTVAEGWLNVDVPGKYTLRLMSDDGSQLRLDGALLIDHDGLHSFKALDTDVELMQGAHPIEIEHFQTYGGYALSLRWKKPGAEDFEVVPSSALSCPKGEVRVTSPGPKKILQPLQKGTPGDGLPLVDHHPSFDVATVRPEGFEPKVGGIAWLSDGRMVLSTWDPLGCVYILDGVQGDDRSKIHVKRFAAGLAEPLGVAVVDDRIFVLQKQELTELIDVDKDGVADVYRCVCSGWNVSANFHEFAFGLVYKDGFFYCNLAIAINPGGRSTNPQVAGRGSTLKISLKEGTYEVVAHGERTPNGIGFGTDGEIFLTDNQGDWLPSSKLLHLKPGAFFGSQAVLLEKAASLPVTPPVLWLPQNEIGNSPSTPALIPKGNGPYSGQMCHGDVTHGGVERDFIEKIDGEYQGCVFDFCQGLEAGINRIAWGPDNGLYVGGIGSTGDWGQEGKLKFGLQRVKYNGAPTFEMLALRAKSDGFEIEFTEELAEGLGWEPENYRVDQWRYVPTTEYGGPKVDPVVLKVVSASVSADRKRVFLELDGMQEGHVVYVHLVGPLVAQSGRTPWTTETWYTLNHIPKNAPGDVVKNPPKTPQNVLSDAERAAGWRLLFDGQTTQSWRGFKQKEMPAGWQIQDGALTRVGEGGDIVTNDEFDDFELALEWKIAEGGNSGIFTRVTEDHGAVWESGPEMQVLDNAKHHDGRNPLTSAGSCYAIYAPKWDVTRPIGLYNRARILVHERHVEYWLNGTQVVEFELQSPDWEKLVAASKFAGMPDYGRKPKGHIALQDHGDRVAFRNIKVRSIPAR